MARSKKIDTKILLAVAVVLILGVAFFAYSNSYSTQTPATQPQETQQPSQQPAEEKTSSETATQTEQQNPCKVKPEVTMSPESISLAPNAKATFVAVVKNTEGLGCTPASFTVEARAPAGWEVKLFSSSYTLQWGDIGRTRIEVRSNVNATTGNYTITAIAKNLNSNLVGEATSIYTVTGQTSASGSTGISGYSVYQ